MITLYYTARTCSLASHIALEDAGAEYELRRIDFASTEQQSPEFLKINPKARVPAMVTPRVVWPVSVMSSMASNVPSSDRSVTSCDWADAVAASAAIAVPRAMRRMKCERTCVTAGYSL